MEYQNLDADSNVGLSDGVLRSEISVGLPSALGKSISCNDTFGLIQTLASANVGLLGPWVDDSYGESCSGYFVDDDFPSQNTTWNASNMQFSAPSKDPPLALPWVDDLTSESQMHSLETEAYSAVLSAFHAQSDRLTWERESLLSELRKELRVSDVEHREFLLKFKSENSVKMIRECHDNVVRQQRVLSNTMKAPLKKQKIAHVPVSSSPRCLPCPPSTAANIFPSAGNLGPGLKPAALTRRPSSIVKDKSSLVVEMKKGLSNVGIEASNRCGDLVHILPTDKLITEVRHENSASLKLTSAGPGLLENFLKHCAVIDSLSVL
ncbi:hypothetical protein ACLOJK_033676 [Asimina triloba]